jgi:hypothetical protein
MSSYAERYAEPVKRIARNGKEYTVEPLRQKHLRPWIAEMRERKIAEDLADIPPMKPEDKAKLISKIRSTEFTPDNLRPMVGSGHVDSVIRVLEIAADELQLQGGDWEAFVDGVSAIQNEKDAYRISGLFFPDDYIARFRDETPGVVHQLIDAVVNGDEAAIVRIAKEAAATFKENKRLAEEAKAKAEREGADPNGQSQPQS